MDSAEATKDPGHGGEEAGYEAEPLDEASSEANRLFTSDFVLAAVANLANAFGVQMLVATLPLYVINLGGSQTDAGLVIGVLSFTALLFRPLMGYLTDAWRRRPLVLIGTSCYGLANVVYFIAGSIPTLLLGRFVHGFGLSCYTTASNAYIADIAPRRRRAEAVGLFAATQAIGLIIGPVVGFALMGKIGFPRLFYFSGGLAFTAFFISCFAHERMQASETERPPWSLRNGIVCMEALPIAWMALCMGLGFGSINAFLSIFAQSRGFRNPGLYFTVQAIVLLASRIFLGRLADRLGRSRVISPGIVFMAAALLLLPFAHSFFYFAMSAAFFGLGFGAAQPATMALLIDRIQPEKRGIATSTYYTGFDGGVTLGSVLLGAVSEHLGFGFMWPIAAACTLLGLTGLAGSKRMHAAAE